jgi:hypothetical protein
LQASAGLVDAASLVRTPVLSQHASLAIVGLAFTTLFGGRRLGIGGEVVEPVVHRVERKVGEVHEGVGRDAAVEPVCQMI